MRKILASMLLITASLGAVALGTRAYFSDTETSTGNSFTAGTIDIAVDGENPWDNVGYFTIEDMKPSTVFHREVTLNNVGNNPVNVWKKITIGAYSDGEHPEPEDSEDANGTINDIGSAIRYGMSINGEVLIDEADNYVMDGGPSLLAGASPLNGQYIYIGRIEPDEDMIVNQSYHMDASVTNWAQGDIMPLEIEFYAQQTSGGAPAPSPELAGRALGDLDYLNIGDVASADMMIHDAQGWKDYVSGNYGGRDGGQDIGIVWGEGGVCDATTQDATFEMNAGAGTANTLTLRHLIGSANDSFDVFVNGSLAGHYTAISGPETWVTTGFTLAGGVTGPVSVRIVPTAAAWASCSIYGQLALNWAQLR